MDLRIDPDRILRPLIVTVITLSALSYVGQVAAYGLELRFDGLPTWLRYTDVDREANLPAWFQSGLIVVIAILLWSIAADSAARENRWTVHWRLLAIAMVYLSIDELTEIHEQTIAPLQRLFGLDGFLYFAWIALAVPLLGVFGLFFLSFLRALPRPTARGIIVAFALYVGGAVAVEMVGGKLYSTIGRETMRYASVVSVEEALEMLGMTIFLVVLARFRTASPQ